MRCNRFFFFCLSLSVCCCLLSSPSFGAAADRSVLVASEPECTSLGPVCTSLSEYGRTYRSLLSDFPDAGILLEDGEVWDLPFGSTGFPGVSNTVAFLPAVSFADIDAKSFLWVDLAFWMLKVSDPPGNRFLVCLRDGIFLLDLDLAAQTVTWRPAPASSPASILSIGVRQAVSRCDRYHESRRLNAAVSPLVARTMMTEVRWCLREIPRAILYLRFLAAVGRGDQWDPVGKSLLGAVAKLERSYQQLLRDVVADESYRQLPQESEAAGRVIGRGASPIRRESTDLTFP